MVVIQQTAGPKHGVQCSCQPMSTDKSTHELHGTERCRVRVCGVTLTVGTQALYLAMSGVCKTRQQASVLSKTLVEYLAIVSEDITKQGTAPRCMPVEHYSGVHGLCHEFDRL